LKSQFINWPAIVVDAALSGWFTLTLTDAPAHPPAQTSGGQTNDLAKIAGGTHVCRGGTFSLVNAGNFTIDGQREMRAAYARSCRTGEWRDRLKPQTHEQTKQ